jgi:hypothetical protein
LLHSNWLPFLDPSSATILPLLLVLLLLLLLLVVVLVVAAVVVLLLLLLVVVVLLMLPGTADSWAASPTLRLMSLARMLDTTSSKFWGKTTTAVVSVQSIVLSIPAPGPPP